MTESAPVHKQEENCPLLKVDMGGGDIRRNSQTPFTAVSPGWTIASGKKLTWLKRWPELFSACWMTFVLLGVSFVVFYALGMSVYRNQRLFFIKCNDSNPSSRVFYHHIITGESYLPFSSYTTYLSKVAEQYPNLRLKLFFLIDDSRQTVYHGPRHGRIINKFLQFRKTNSFEKNNRKDIEDFQFRYNNVNITILPLSTYMAFTPMRYRLWRNMPTSYLTFYLRVFSVWQNGGVAMDLSVFNAKYNSRFVDNRITGILKQHNDGIKPESYSSLLKKVDQKEESAEENEIFGLIHQIFSEIRTYLNKTLSSSIFENDTEVPLQRRRILKDNDGNDTVNYVSASNSSEDIEDKVNKTMSRIVTSPNNMETLNSSVLNNSALVDINEMIGSKDFKTNSSVVKLGNNSSDIPMLVFYDFSFLTDGMGSSYMWPDLLNIFGDSTKRAEVVKKVKENKTVHVLAIDSDGTFVAASSHLHPLLGYLIANGCHQLHPRFAIQDALLTQCSGYFRKDVYCDNIYLL